MTSPLGDQDIRQCALDPASSVIVQAPAGSGKTGLLTRRFLRLLSCVAQPEEIVAITFTRKAAGEMRQRIIESLQAVASGGEAEDSEYTALAKAALGKHKANGLDLAENLARLRIETIDSFVGSIIRQLPLSGRTFPITEEASWFYQKAAEIALASREDSVWSASIIALLQHLDHRHDRARDLLSDMLASRGQWCNRLDALQDDSLIERDFAHFVFRRLQRLIAAFPGEARDDLLEQLRNREKAHAMLEDAPLPAEENWQKTDLSLEEGVRTPDALLSDTLPKWQEIANFLLTKEGTWRKSTRSIGLGVKEIPDKALRRTMCAAHSRLLEALAPHETLRAALLEVRYLPCEISAPESDLMQHLVVVFKLAMAALQVLFHEAEVSDHSGMMLFTLGALRQDAAQANELGLKLNQQISHLLIDEFQDVSSAQYELLLHLTEHWFEGDGKTLFLVGDPMQSIYQFRDARVEIFIMLFTRKRLGKIPLIPLTMTTNFRSGNQVLSWVNKTFSALLPKVVDPDCGAMPYTPAVAYHKASTDSDGVFCHTVVTGDDMRWQEALEIRDLILHSQKQYPDETIAILVRSRSALVNILPCLMAAQIEISGVDLAKLGHRSEIEDLLSLLQALVTPTDRLAWFSLLRAPWCGLCGRDLLLIKEHSSCQLVIDVLGEDALIRQLSTGAQVRVRRFREVLLEALQAIGRRTDREVLETAWIALGGPATLKSRSALDNVERFFSLLDYANLRHPSRFFMQLDGLYAAPNPDDPASAVQVMTMHKAKGLQFDTVIIPGLDRVGRSPDKPLIRWHSFLSDRERLLASPVQKKKAAGKGTLYHYLDFLEKQKERSEADRLLYVAVTRAKKKAHLFAGTKRHGAFLPPGSPAARLEAFSPKQEPEGKAEEKQGIAQELSPLLPEKPDQRASAPSCLQRLKATWQLPAVASLIVAPSLLPSRQRRAVRRPEYQWAGHAIRQIGTVVHRFLYRIAEEGLATWSDERIKASREMMLTSLAKGGIGKADMEEALETTQSALINTLNDKRGRWILSAHQNARSEYALSTVINGNITGMILDRTFIDEDGTRYIIDYKVSRYRGSELDPFLEEEVVRYRDQLLGYQRALYAKTNESSICLALYFPLYAAWRKIQK